MDNRLLIRLQHLCSRQECCTKDIMAKALKALDGDMESAGAIVEALMKDKYLDDSRYAAAYAREKASLSGWGEAKIRYHLLSKGISAENISSGLSEIDSESSANRMRAVISSKKKNLAGDPEIKLKLLRFALSRGYSYEEVRTVVEELLSSSSS